MATRFVAGTGTPMRIVSAVEVLAPFPALPEYCAVMLCDPVARVLVVMLACAEPSKAVVPINAALS